MSLYIFLFALKLLLPLFTLLFVYEAARGVVSLKKGDSRLLVAKDFTAAAAILALIAMVLYIWRGHLFQ
jgi:uncharacterized membrane protein